MKRNIVGSVIVITLSFWVPFSCCVHFCIDKRQRALQKMFIQQNIDKRLAAERMSDEAFYMSDADRRRLNQAELNEDEQSDEELKRINASKSIDY